MGKHSAEIASLTARARDLRSDYNKARTANEGEDNAERFALWRRQKVVEDAAKAAEKEAQQQLKNAATSQEAATKLEAKAAQEFDPKAAEALREEAQERRMVSQRQRDAAESAQAEAAQYRAEGVKLADQDKAMGVEHGQYLDKVTRAEKSIDAMEDQVRELERADRILENAAGAEKLAADYRAQGKVKDAERMEQLAAEERVSAAKAEANAAAFGQQVNEQALKDAGFDAPLAPPTTADAGADPSGDDLLAEEAATVARATATDPDEGGEVTADPDEGGEATPDTSGAAVATADADPIGLAATADPDEGGEVTPATSGASVAAADADPIGLGATADPDEGGEVTADPDEGGEVMADPDEGGEVTAANGFDPAPAEPSVAPAPFEPDLSDQSIAYEEQSDFGGGDAGLDGGTADPSADQMDYDGLA
jgi:hypothetical protein